MKCITETIVHRYTSKMLPSATYTVEILPGGEEDAYDTMRLTCSMHGSETVSEYDFPSSRAIDVLHALGANGWVKVTEEGN